MSPTVTHAVPSVPVPVALPSPVVPRRTALYLVGEAERTTSRPVAATGRTMVSVNGRWTALRGRTMSYGQLLRIVYPDREGQQPGTATVTYRRSGGGALTGLMTPGDVVELADGLLFNVNATYAS